MRESRWFQWGADDVSVRAFASSKALAKKKLEAEVKDLSDYKYNFQPDDAVGGRTVEFSKGDDIQIVFDVPFGSGAPKERLAGIVKNTTGYKKTA